MNKKTAFIVIHMIVLLLHESHVYSQLPEGLYGVVDDFFVSVESAPVGIETILELESFDGERIRTLAYSPAQCRYFGVIDASTTPKLVWFDYQGNQGVVGQLTLNGLPLPMCEALAFNPLDNQLYAGVSIDGNPNNNDFHSETIVKVEQNSAECTFITGMGGDIDAMVFVEQYLYISDSENGSLVISNILFQNLPTSIAFNPILNLDEDIFIVDLANPDGADIIYCTSGHDLYGLNVSVQPTVLQWLGITHSNSDYNGERMFGLASAVTISSDFEINISENTAEFAPEQLFNSEVNYFWDFGDGNSSTVYNPTHTFSESGTYEICLTTEYRECTYTSCKEFTILTLAIRDNYEKISFLKASPNPTSNNVLIELQTEEDKIQVIEIYDISGKLVEKQSGVMMQSILIDMSYLPSGEYFVIVNNKYFKEIIKN
jgi:Secretion system C-terminal sorting domain/PKD domain